MFYACEIDHNPAKIKQFDESTPYLYSMKVLVTAATLPEIQPLLNWLGEHAEQPQARCFTMGSLEVEVLLTGIGMTSTAYQLGKYFARSLPKVAIQAGIGGCFQRSWPIGDTVLVSREIFGDLGADDNGQFRDLFGIGLWQHDSPPFTHHYLVNTLQNLPAWSILDKLKRATGITVNTVSGSAPVIERLERLYEPDIESMEGAAFHYCCLMEHVPFLQLRTISNYVEIRDKSKWNIPLAIKNLNDTLCHMLAELP